MLFCDHCGAEFSPGTLRPESKFCTRCGKELSEYVKSQCSDLFNTPSWKTSGQLDGMTSRKRANAAMSDDEESSRRRNDISSEKYSQEHGKRETRGRPRKSHSLHEPNAAIDTDQTTSTTSREDDDTEVSTGID
jgi:hypothetical protein